MLEKDTNEELERILDAEDVEKVQEVVVIKWELLGSLGHAQGNGFSETPEADRTAWTRYWYVVKKVVDEALQNLKMGK